MTQSYLKIMSGEDRSDGHHNKEFTILPLAEGISVEFRQDPMPVAILSNGVSYPVTGNAYVTNQNGKSVATFTPIKQYVLDDEPPAKLETEIYVESLKAAKIDEDSPFEILVSHDVDGEFKYELVGPWRHVFSDGSNFYASGKDGAVRLGNSLRMISKSLNTSIQARDRIGHYSFAMLSTLMLPIEKTNVPVTRILAKECSELGYIITRSDMQYTLPLQGGEAEVTLADGTAGRLVDIVPFVAIPGTSVAFDGSVYYVVKNGSDIKIIECLDLTHIELNSLAPLISSNGQHFLLNRKNGSVYRITAESWVTYGNKNENLQMLMLSDAVAGVVPGNLSLRSSLADLLGSNSVAILKDVTLTPFVLKDVVKFEHSAMDGLDFATGDFMFKNQPYRPCDISECVAFPGTIWSSDGYTYICYLNLNLNGGKGLVQVFTNKPA